MKKKVLVLATLLAATTTTFAQDLTSRKGEPFLPEAGDWAISFDATPFLNFAGGVLGGNASAPTLNYTNGYPWSIRGKMFSTETTAYRAGIRLGFGSWTEAALIDDASDNLGTPAGYPTPNPTVEDQFKNSYNSIVLSGGLEMRRGKTRLQGYYGGEVLIGFSGTTNTFTYGNALNTNTDATGVDASSSFATDWSGSGAMNLSTDAFGNPARFTEQKSSTMMIGLRGFIGVEYFILPKISLGAEYGWGLGFSSMTSTSSMESRGLNTAGNLTLGTFEEETKTSGFAIDSDIQNSATGLLGGSGSINIIFHF